MVETGMVLMARIFHGAGDCSPTKTKQLHHDLTSGASLVDAARTTYLACWMDGWFPALRTACTGGQ